jgi:hypothetical protein
MENKYITEVGWPQVHGTPSSVLFHIQSGPIKEFGVNGCQIDDVIRWAKEKIVEFNEKFPCPENHAAIVNLQGAIDNLEFRRKSREQRGVEGTSAR